MSWVVFEKLRPDGHLLYYKAELSGGVYYLKFSPTADEAKRALYEYDDFPISLRKKNF